MWASGWLPAGGLGHPGPVLTFLLQLLHVPQLFHVVGVAEPQLHADEGLPALQAQLVPGLGPRQQVGHGALCQPQDALTKQPLPWGQGRRQLSPQALRDPLSGQESQRSRPGRWAQRSVCTRDWGGSELDSNTETVLSSFPGEHPSKLPGDTLSCCIPPPNTQGYPSRFSLSFKHV